MSPYSSTVIDYRALWAKSSPRHPLWRHLLDTAAVSMALSPPVSEFGWNANCTALLVGLHDVGKADGYFQHRVSEFSEELSFAGFARTEDAPRRHEQLSAEFIRKKLMAVGIDPYVADAVFRALSAHHGHWHESMPLGVGKHYYEAQEQLYEMLKHVLQVDELSKEIPSDLSSFGMRLTGHVVLCDWIASNQAFFHGGRFGNFEGLGNPEEYFEKAQEVGQEWVIKLGLRRHQEAGRARRIVATPRPIQEALLESEIPPGLVIIEAPMGEGKTEAAWILAEKWRDKGYHGMYMALPTMATSDSLYNRYLNDYLKKLGRGDKVKLVHGMAWLRDDIEPEVQLEVGETGEDRSLATAWFRPTRRALLAEHGVGTVDQAMLAGMNVKFGFLRLYGLADRVLVIDEVHAYDAYMSVIISRLLQWCACLRIPVILLSATLSAPQRASMLEAYGSIGDLGTNAPYPLITVAEAGSCASSIECSATLGRNLKIETHVGSLGDSEKAGAMAAELVRDGGCCCIILNTVRQAQSVYHTPSLRDVPKLLFHSRFTAEDREAITRQVIEQFGKVELKDKNGRRVLSPSKRPDKFVLVATQVVEQSLDVDFDSMISEIAPIDLLLQRSGRLHRHRKRKESPTLHVLLPAEKDLAFGGTCFVYSLKPLLRTMAIISHKSEVILPDDLRVLIECCYGSKEWDQRTVPWEMIKKADKEWDDEIRLLRDRGRQFCLCEPNHRLFRPVNNDPEGDDTDDGNGWRAKTRLGANDRTAVLVKKDEMELLKMDDLDMKEIRSLCRRAVKLPAYLPVHTPVAGYGAGVNGRGRLRGLTLLPLSKSEVWQGRDEMGHCYQISYNRETGLLAGRIK